MLQASGSPLAAAHKTRPAATPVTNNAEAGEGPEVRLPQHPEIGAETLCEGCAGIWQACKYEQCLGSLSAPCTGLTSFARLSLHSGQSPQGPGPPDLAFASLLGQAALPSRRPLRSGSQPADPALQGGTEPSRGPAPRTAVESLSQGQVMPKAAGSVCG